MGNKIITEEDFWECTGGLMPVPLQSSQRLVYTNGRKAKKYITLADKSTVSWVDFGCKKLILLYAVIAAVAALCAATGGVALIAICALAGAAGAMWGAVVGSLLCGQLAAMARVWCSSKDDFQILGINTITGKDTMQCLAFTFIGQNPETITYKPGVKSWSQALATGAANLIGGLFEGMMYGACIGSAFAAGAALAGGASAGGGLAGMGRVALNFIKSIPRNILTNIAESYSAMGMGMRGVMSAQSALTTYGELGDEMTREDLGNAVSRGFWSMETGTYESGKNILTGNGKMEDYMGIALNLTPTGQGAREVFPHNSNYQKMGIVPDNLAGKMDLDGGVKKAPDADGGVKKSVSDDGLPVKKQGSSKSRKPKGKNGKAYEKTKLVDIVKERAENIMKYSSATKRGPCLTGIYDKVTGEISFGQNFNLRTVEGRKSFELFKRDAHPIIKARIEAYQKKIADGSINPNPSDGTPGAHSEIVALDNALKSREKRTGKPATQDILGEFELHNRSMSNNRPNETMHRCGNCDNLTKGVDVVGGHD